MRWRANRLLLALTIFSVGGQLLPCDVLARAQETTPAPKTEATEKPDAPPAPTEPAPAEPSSGEPAKPQTQEPPPAASEPAPTRERPSRGPGRPTDAPRGRGSGARPTEGGTEQSSKEQAQRHRAGPSRLTQDWSELKNNCLRSPSRFKAYKKKHRSLLMFQRRISRPTRPHRLLQRKRKVGMEFSRRNG